MEINRGDFLIKEFEGYVALHSMKWLPVFFNFNQSGNKILAKWYNKEIINLGNSHNVNLSSITDKQLIEAFLLYMQCCPWSSITTHFFDTENFQTLLCDLVQKDNEAIQNLLIKMIEDLQTHNFSFAKKIICWVNNIKILESVYAILSGKNLNEYKTRLVKYLLQCINMLKKTEFNNNANKRKRDEESYTEEPGFVPELVRLIYADEISILKNDELAQEMSTIESLNVANDTSIIENIDPIFITELASYSSEIQSLLINELITENDETDFTTDTTLTLPTLPSEPPLAETQSPSYYITNNFLTTNSFLNDIETKEEFENLLSVEDPVIQADAINRFLN